MCSPLTAEDLGGPGARCNAQVTLWRAASAFLCPFSQWLLGRKSRGGAGLTLMPLEYLFVSLCNREVADLRP